MGIRRHYVKIGRRRVHFRAGGEGPVALLLHQSPQSSTAMMPLAEKLRSRYCVVAPDSPGFGLSDPLAVETPTIEDIADALDEFAAALGLPEATVIGVHTGAEIALEFALRYPERVGFLILDGLALFTAEESEDILRHYLPPFTPRWDGSHLTWLWARLREQTIFFPWYKKDQAARELIVAAAVEHYVICPDLPGHGESADLAAGGFSLEKTTAVLTELLARIGRDSCRLLGLGAGCVLIPPLLSAVSGPSLRAAMHNPLLLDAETRAALQDRFAPPITPDDYGLFLTQLWYALRDGRLFWPWCEPLAANIRQHPPSLVPEVIHQALFDALRCGDRYAELWRAFFATDFISAMRAASAPLSITLSKTHPCLDNAQAALASLPEGACHETADHWRDILNSHFPP